MSNFLNPTHWIQRFLTEVSSHEMRFKSGTTVAIPDSVLQIEDESDPTKVVVFSAGGLTTATTRTVTFPDFDFTIGGPGARVSALLGSDDVSLAVTQSGAVIAAAAAEDYTLPAITATEAGVWFEFFVVTLATSLTITTASGDVFIGGATIMSTSAGAENDAFSAGATDNTITLNGTTSGGIVGSWIRVVANKAGTGWLTHANLIGSGTIVTPFSTV